MMGRGETAFNYGNGVRTGFRMGLTIGFFVGVGSVLLFMAVFT